ncbi:hypothetical protein lerEdw1_003507, partial [Lerista edwardsae]
ALCVPPAPLLDDDEPDCCGGGCCCCCCWGTPWDIAGDCTARNSYSGCRRESGALAGHAPSRALGTAGAAAANGARQGRGARAARRELWSLRMWRPRALCRALLRVGGATEGGASGLRASAACWSCGRPSPSPAPRFCPACRALQPPEPGQDLFRTMGCEVTFRLDVAQLQRQFWSLQRSLHPDNFSQRPQAEQGFSEQHSSLVNKAYRTLRSPLSRGLYLLELSGVELERGTDHQASPDFLTEVLEMNEKLAEADGEGKIEALGADLAAKQEELTEGVGRAFDRGDLQEAKRLLAKMKYFANLEDKVKAKKVPS